MIEVYLNLNGNAAEAAAYYARVFEAPDPYVMPFSQIPQGEQENAPDNWKDLVMHANVKTFAGDIMLSDNPPDQESAPSAALNICLSHTDLERLRRVFERLAKDGEVIMPLEPTFFSPLFGQVRDKFGFYWMIMSSEEVEF